MTVADWTPPEQVYPELALRKDQARRHFDLVDAEHEVRRLERDYEIHMRWERCQYRTHPLYHIEFAYDRSSHYHQVLQAYVDGYVGADMEPLMPGHTARQLSYVLKHFAHRVGLNSRYHLITLATYYGICIPTLVIDTGEKRA